MNCGRRDVFIPCRTFCTLKWCQCMAASVQVSHLQRKMFDELENWMLKYGRAFTAIRARAASPSWFVAPRKTCSIEEFQEKRHWMDFNVRSWEGSPLPGFRLLFCSHITYTNARSSILVFPRHITGNLYPSWYRCLRCNVGVIKSSASFPRGAATSASPSFSNTTKRGCP